LRDIPSLIETVFADTALAVVCIFPADELSGLIVVDLNLEASRGMAVVVSPNEVHVLTGGGDYPGYLMGALVGRGACCALRHVILVCITTNARVPTVCADMLRRLVFLEVKSPLEMVNQRLFLPRYLLIGV